jgi:hypothetical protein
MFVVAFRIYPSLRGVARSKAKQSHPFETSNKKGIYYSQKLLMEQIAGTKIYARQAVYMPSFGEEYIRCNPPFT